MITELEKKENVKTKKINGEHGFYNYPNAINKEIIKEIEEDIYKIIEL